MQRLRKYQQLRRAAFRKLVSNRSAPLKHFGPKLAREWQRLVDERKGSKSEHTPFRRHDVDPGDQSISCNTPARRSGTSSLTSDRTAPHKCANLLLGHLL